MRLGTTRGAHQRGKWLALVLHCGSLCAVVGVMVQCPVRCAAQGNKLKRPQGVIAHLGEQEITYADVDMHLGRNAQAELPKLEWATLQNAIHLVAVQRQALQTLRRLKLAVDQEAIERYVSANKPDHIDAAADAEEILKTIAAEQNVSVTSYSDLLAFRLSWKAYLAKHLNQANLSKHFENQKSRFDGTEFEILAISLATVAGDCKPRRLAQERLKENTELLDVDVAEFETRCKAAGIQPSGPVKIRGTGQLDPALVTAIMKLDVGETSAPVHTASGVHLVRLLDKSAGDRELEQVRDEVRGHMLLFLLEHLARQSEAELPLKPVVP